MGPEPIARGHMTSPPRMGMDPGGRATIVWTQKIPSQSDPTVHTNQFVIPAAASFKARTVTSLGGYDRRPEVAVDSRGNALAVWVKTTDFYSDMGDIYAVRFEEDRGWVSETWLAEAWYDAEPRVAMDASGGAIAVWDGTPMDYCSCGVSTSLYRRGIGWGEPLVHGHGHAPRIDMDAEGNAALIWAGGEGNPEDVYVKRFVTVTGWTGRVHLGKGEHATVALGPQGEAIAVWTSSQGYGGGHFDGGVYVSRFSEETGWNPPANLWSGLPVGEPTLAVDDQGNAIVAWAGRSTSGEPTIWTSRNIPPDKSPPNLSLVSPLSGLMTDVPTATVAGITEPSASVLVNGIQALVEPDGSFTLSLTLHEGLNIITVTATDSMGNVANVTTEVTYASSLPLLKGRIHSLGMQVLLLLVVVVALLLVTGVQSVAYSNLRKKVRGRGVSRLRPRAVASGKVEARLGSQDPSLADSAAWPRSPPDDALYLTTKERILLHLLETVREVREDEAPRDATQGGISTGAGVDLRHFAQYIGPLVEASYVVERTGRVKGVLRRLKVYTLTAEGRRLASSIRDRVYAAVVRIRDAEEVREAKIVEIVSRRPDAPVLDIVREAIEEGCVDLNTDEGTSSGGI